MKKTCYRYLVALVALCLLLTGCQTKTEPKPKKVKKTFSSITYYKKENLSRYVDYQKQHSKDSLDTIVTTVNMYRDYDFYENIVKQTQPNELNTIVNKYYQLDLSYEPSDLVEINAKDTQYGKSYLKHTARRIVYDDFQRLVSECRQKGFDLYVVSGYRSNKWQEKIYQHMVDTYDQNRADQTCSRPGHSEHTTGLGLDIALDSYHYEDVKKHPQYEWFLSKLVDYGFILRYPANSQNITGYDYEPWHIRYLGKNLAKKVENSGLTYEEYYAMHF